MESLSGGAEGRNHERGKVPRRQRLPCLVLNSLDSVITLAGSIRLRSLREHSILECALALIRS